MGSEFADEFHGFEADCDYLTDQADSIFGVVGAVRVVDYAAAFVCGDLVLVDDPFQGAAVAEAVFVDFGRDAAQGQEAVVLDLGFVFGQGHPFDAPVELAGFGALERVLGLLLVFDVEFHQVCADFRVLLEGWGVGDSWKFALEVGGVAGAVLGVVEQGIGVVEDFPLGDGLLAVVGVELGELARQCKAGRRRCSVIPGSCDRYFKASIPQTNTRKLELVVLVGQNLEISVVLDLVSFAEPRQCPDYSDVLVHLVRVTR